MSVILHTDICVSWISDLIILYFRSFHGRFKWRREWRAAWSHISNTPIQCYATSKCDLHVGLWIYVGMVSSCYIPCNLLLWSVLILDKQMVVDCVWNVMAHTQKQDFVFRRNGRVHLNRQGRQFPRLPAAEVCASAVVTFRGNVKRTGYPLHSPVSPSLPLLRHRVPSHFSWTLQRLNIQFIVDIQ